MRFWHLPDHHDRDNLKAALKHVTDFSLAVDGGAHRGIWTRPMLKTFREVWAFEPVVEHFERLPDDSTNILGALGVGGNCGISAGPENDGQYFVDGEGDIKILPLDMFDLKHCGFIKLDVEGYEYFALQGAEETIIKFKPVLMVEDNGLCERYGIKTGSCDDLIKGWRYRKAEQVNHDSIYIPR